MKILVTGAAGFIGFHTVSKLLSLTEHHIYGIDNLNDYYDVDLKTARLANLTSSKFFFKKIDLTNKSNLTKFFAKHDFDIVINLAAQAGVRYSLTHPEEYINSNIVGFLNILELCRHSDVQHLVYASSSSVYGLNESLPFSVSQNVDHPKSLYAASKKSNELMAHTYSHLFNLPTTGLRFFTVYGPWGRPDMALFLFTKAIFEERPIDVFNHGLMQRDFTYIDDIVDGVIKTLDRPASINIDWKSDKPDPGSSNAPWRIYNIGNNKPVQLMQYIEALEKTLEKKANINFLPLQPGDVPDTYANVDNLKEQFNFKPSTPVIDGVTNFIKWYKNYYQI